jgi:hypothetical protein
MLTTFSRNASFLREARLDGSARSFSAGSSISFSLRRSRNVRRAETSQ